jgi:hypothetical protein
LPEIQDENIMMFVGLKLLAKLELFITDEENCSLTVHHLPKWNFSKLVFKKYHEKFPRVIVINFEKNNILFLHMQYSPLNTECYAHSHWHTYE